MRKDNLELLKKGVALNLVGGLMDNKAVSGFGAGIATLAVLDEALNKPVKSKKKGCLRG